MSENLKKFLELVSKDVSLQEELKKLKDLSKEEIIKKIIEVAKTKNIVLNESDFEDQKMSSENLKKLTGGGCFIYGEGSECLCPVLGVAMGAFCIGIGNTDKD